MGALDSFFSQLHNAVGYVNRRIAQLGRADGTISAGDGFVYLRPQNGGETRAKNPGVVSTHVPDAWVEIGENTRTGELEVIRVATEMLYTHGENLTNRTATSDVSPEHFAGMVPGDAIQDLKVRAPDATVAGLNVCIEGGWTEYGYSYKQHASVAAYVPATVGTRRIIVSFLDVNNVVYFSTAYTSESLMAADVLALQVPTISVLAVPYGAYPLYAFILEQGQTEVTAANTIFVNMRRFVDANGVVSPGWLVRTPTTVPTGAIMTQPGTVRVTASLTLNGAMYVI